MSDSVIIKVYPRILSASRATDIPGFHSKWFMERLREGFSYWRNPFNSKQIQKVDYSRVRLIVFWTKNPDPILPYLKEIDEMGINYYFQYTLNNYEKEKLEPNLPPLLERIRSFISLSERLSSERVIWRFDPLLLTESLVYGELIERVEEAAAKLSGYTQKLVFSFADIIRYRKVSSRLREHSVREFSQEEMLRAGADISSICKKYNLKGASCAESINLSDFGIEANKCIDDKLILRISPEDDELLSYLGYEPGLLGKVKAKPAKKDKGQRRDCGCVGSKDIGKYNTCSHFCLYCYANSLREKVEGSMSVSEYSESL